MGSGIQRAELAGMKVAAATAHAVHAGHSLQASDYATLAWAPGTQTEHLHAADWQGRTARLDTEKMRGRKGRVEYRP